MSRFAVRRGAGVSPRGVRAAWAIALSIAAAASTAAFHQQPRPPSIVKRVPPVYPESARQRNIEGDVVVEATVGADGKVTAVTVVRSIPELDAAAVDAVRQWEYTPTILNGVAVPVLMTVTVNFSLERPPPAGDMSDPPLQLSHAGTGWMLNGQRVEDRELRQTLMSGLRSRVEKHVVVRVPESLSYRALIAILVEIHSAGAERTLLADADDGLERAVAVRLEPVPGFESDLQLAFADILAESPRVADAIITLPASGAPEPLPAQALQKAAASVRLRIDAGRSLADVWPLLRIGRSASVDLFLLAVERPDGPGVVARRCRAGGADECGQLGWWHFTGSEGLAANYDAAVALLRKACAGGHVQSCGILAEMYESGTGVARDLAEAIRLHTESCRLGGVDSCEALRRRGHPVPPKKPPY